MSDINNNDSNNKYSHLSEERRLYVEKGVQKLHAIKALKKFHDTGSKWNLVQEILQEIIASHIVANPERLPKTPQLLAELKKEIEVRYEDDPELKQLVLESIPSVRSVRDWMKKDGWDEAVWDKIRKTGLFTAEKRAEMINALFERGARGKDTQAAKIWLTLSGDYSEKASVDNKTLETYREINKVLHKKVNE